MMARPFPSPCFVVCVCVQDHPPEHHRFNDPDNPAHKKIPSHITYAYKPGATIARNDDFYSWPETGTKQVDLLFLIASAPVSTMSVPVSGSQDYVGAAMVMKLAVEQLSKKFPSFFKEHK